MDYFKKWYERESRVFGKDESLFISHNSNEAYFADVDTKEIKIKSSVTLYARIYGKFFEWAWNFNKGLCIDETKKIKNLGLKSKILLKSYDEEKSYYQLIVDTCNVDELFSTTNIDDNIRYLYLYGLTNIEELHGNFKKLSSIYKEGINKKISDIIFKKSICFNCKEICKTPLRCSNCKKIIYCSKNCQKKDWINHKNICNFNNKLISN